MNFWKHKCLCNAINKTNDIANCCVKHYQMLIIVCMLLYHLVCFLPLVGFSAIWRIFCHMVGLLPRVGFLSVDGISATERTSTISGLSDIDGFSTNSGLSDIDGFSTNSGLSDIDGFSTISGLSTTWGAFCRWGLCHWWDFSRLEGSTTIGGFSALMKQTKKKGINTQSFGRCHHSEVARTWLAKGIQ